jgi:riboflavin biosynthesis pyrimidine reductase
MAGGTTFHFLNETPEEVLRQAFKAAGGQDVRLAGGSSAIRQFLHGGLVDEMHLAVVPGERLYNDLGTLPGYEISSVVHSPAVTHVTFTKSS